MQTFVWLDGCAQVVFQPKDFAIKSIVFPVCQLLYYFQVLQGASKPRECRIYSVSVKRGVAGVEFISWSSIPLRLTAFIESAIQQQLTYLPRERTDPFHSLNGFLQNRCGFI